MACSASTTVEQLGRYHLRRRPVLLQQLGETGSGVDSGGIDTRPRFSPSCGPVIVTCELCRGSVQRRWLSVPLSEGPRKTSSKEWTGGRKPPMARRPLETLPAGDRLPELSSSPGDFANRQNGLPGSGEPYECGHQGARRRRVDHRGGAVA